MRHRSPVVVVLGALVTVLFAASSAAPQSSAPREDLVLGTWHLDLARSKYIPGPPPKSETRIYERDGKAIKTTIRRVFADGRPDVVEYTSDYDNPYPVTGSADVDRVQMKRIDEFRADSVLSHAGRVFGIASRVISDDGQTMTIRFRREGAELVNNTAYYRRAPVTQAVSDAPAAAR